MIKQIQGNYSAPKVEKEVQEEWASEHAYEKTKQLRENGPRFYFLDGPPYTTGSIHLGTAMNKTVKDILIRYWRMNGYNVRDQPGFDMHGLPIEVQVEKKIGVHSKKQIEEEIVEVGKRTTIDLGIHGLHPELIRMIGKMKYRSSYGQNLLQHARETANLAGIMASELGLNPKIARRAGLLHDIGKVPDDEPELPHAIIGMKLAEKFKEKPEVCNAIGAHHDEVEMTSLIAPIIQVCDAISGARPGARREVVESYIKRLKEMEDIALSYPGVVKTYAIQAGRELRVIVGADKLSDQESEGLSHDIAKKIQDEMTYPGQVKITVIRETRAVSYAK